MIRTLVVDDDFMAASVHRRVRRTRPGLRGRGRGHDGRRRPSPDRRATARPRAARRLPARPQRHRRAPAASCHGERTRRRDRDHLGQGCERAARGDAPRRRALHRQTVHLHDAERATRDVRQPEDPARPPPTGRPARSRPPLHAPPHAQRTPDASEGHLRAHPRTRGRRPSGQRRRAFVSGTREPHQPQPRDRAPLPPVPRRLPAP